MDHIDAVSTIVTALGPVATGILGIFMRRSDRRKIEKLDQVAHQVGPNGGDSIRDAVDRIEATVTQLGEKVADAARRVEAIEIDRRRWTEKLETGRLPTRVWWRI